MRRPDASISAAAAGLSRNCTDRNVCAPGSASAAVVDFGREAGERTHRFGNLIDFTVRKRSDKAFRRLSGDRVDLHELDLATVRSDLIQTIAEGVDLLGGGRFVLDPHEETLDH